MGKIKKEKNSLVSQEKKCSIEVIKKRKNCERKKNLTEEGERKYGYISANSITTIAEAAGFSTIPEDVAKNLAEDVTYRLRYIVQQCKKFMIHSKRKKLSSSDITEVLKICDGPKTYGYASSTYNYNFTFVKEAEVFVLEDNVIDLPSLVLTEMRVLQKSVISAKGQWLKPEDKSRTEIKLKHDEVQSPIHEIRDAGENVKNTSKSSALCDNQNVVFENEENESKIPTNLIKYYGVTCNTILGHSDLKMIFQDLSTNGRIVPIIPYLLNFITIALNKLKSNRQIKRLLQTIEALSQNKQVDFCPYSATTRVINAMLLIVAVDKTPSRTSCNCHLRLYASRVLSLVLSQWCTRDEQKLSVTKKMIKLLLDFQVSPKVHYGALSLLTALGPETLSMSFWQILKQYLTYLQDLRKRPDYVAEDVAILEEALLAAVVLLYRNPKLLEDSVLADLDRSLSSYFGDAICNLWLHALENPKCLTSRPAENKTGTGKKSSRAYKHVNFNRQPNSKKFFLENVFSLPKPKNTGNKKIIFKFAGAIPMLETNLKRKNVDKHSKFMDGKEKETYVVIAKQTKHISSYRLSLNLPVGCLFSIL